MPDADKGKHRMDIDMSVKSVALVFAVTTIGLLGVVMAGIIVVSLSGGGSDDPLGLVGKDFADTAECLGLVVFLAVLAFFAKLVKGKAA